MDLTQLRALMGLTASCLIGLSCSPAEGGSSAASTGKDGGTVGAGGSGEMIAQPAGNGGNLGGSGGLGGAAGSAGGASETDDAGTGGTGGSGGIGGSNGGGGVVCYVSPALSQAECDAASTLMTSMVSDFENGSGWILFANPEDIGATTTPAAGGNISSTQISCSADGRCGSQYAMHVSGSGFTKYGATLSKDYVYADGTDGGAGMVQDVSDYTGIMYWARTGDTAVTSSTLRLILNDIASSPAGNICDPNAMASVGGAPQDGGASVDGASTDGVAPSEAGVVPSNACWDGWMIETALTSTWTLVKVPFSSLKQGGWGKHGDAFLPKQLYGLTFQMPNRATFDFWIDDVAFYK